jgi:hypothetical protein
MGGELRLGFRSGIRALLCPAGAAFARLTCLRSPRGSGGLVCRKSGKPAQGFKSRAVLAVAVGFVPEAVTAVPAPGQVDEYVVDDVGRLLAGTELVQLEAVVFRPEIGGDGPARSPYGPGGSRWCPSPRSRLAADAASELTAEHRPGARQGRCGHFSLVPLSLVWCEDWAGSGDLPPWLGRQGRANSAARAPAAARGNSGAWRPMSGGTPR